MNADHALKVLVQSAREAIQASVADTMQVLRTGKGQEFHNPFTGKTQEKHVSPELRLVATKLAECGLVADEPFLAVLEKAVQGVASRPMFSLFTALDGGGSLVEEVEYEVHAKDVGPLPAYLHEVLYPIEGNLLTEKDR